MSQIDTTATEPFVKERLVLLIERELRYQLDEILPKMQKLAKDFRIDLKKDKDGRISKDKDGRIKQDKKSERSPLRNLLVTATERTASLETIKNYISYQASRAEDVGAILKSSYEGEGRDLYEGDKFGAALIKALDELKENAEEILDRITEGLTDDSALKKYLKPQVRSREVTDLHLKLVQLYLGYLVREHTALRVLKPDLNSGNQNDNRPPDPTARPQRRSESERPKQKQK